MQIQWHNPLCYTGTAASRCVAEACTNCMSQSRLVPVMRSDICTANRFKQFRLASKLHSVWLGGNIKCCLRATYVQQIGPSGPWASAWPLGKGDCSICHTSKMPIGCCTVPVFVVCVPDVQCSLAFGLIQLSMDSGGPRTLAEKKRMTLPTVTVLPIVDGRCPALSNRGSVTLKLNFISNIARVEPLRVSIREPEEYLGWRVSSSSWDCLACLWRKARWRVSRSSSPDTVRYRWADPSQAYHLFHRFSIPADTSCCISLSHRT